MVAGNPSGEATMTKRTKMAAGAGLGLIGLVGATVVFGPSLFRDELIAEAERVMTRQLGATTEVGYADVHLLRTFPRVEVRLSDVSIAGAGAFDESAFLTAGSVGVAFDLIDVWNGQYTVRSLYVDDAALNAVVDGDATNFNFGAESASADSAEKASDAGTPSLRLDQVMLSDVDVRWTDREGGLSLVMDDLVLEGQGGIDASTVAFETESQVAELRALSDDEAVVHSLRLTADGSGTYDLDSGLLEVSDAKATLNELPVAFDLSLQPEGEAWQVEADFDTEEGTARQLISLVPPSYRGPMDELEADGVVQLQLAIDGLLDAGDDAYPRLEGALSLREGSARLAGMPRRIDPMTLDVTVLHEQGPLEATSVDVRRLEAHVDDSDLVVMGRVDDVLGDPALDLDVAGDLDLATVFGAIPMEGYDGEGTLDLDLAVKGRQSALVAGTSKGVDVDGTVQADGITLWLDWMPDPLQVEQADIVLTSTGAEVQPYRIRFGETAMSGDATLTNLVGYALDGTVLSGRITAQSDRIDLTPFMSEDADGTDADGGSEGSSEDSGVLTVPEELDVTVALDAGAVSMDDWTLTDVDGTVSMRDGTLSFERLGADIADGRVTASGSYAPRGSGRADIDLRADLQSASASALRDSFDIVGRFVPGAVDLSGRLGGSLDVSGALDGEMALKPASIDGSGALTVANVALGAEVLTRAADRLGSSADRIRVDRETLRFAVDQGRLELRPTTVSLGSFSTTASGAVDLAGPELDLGLASEVPVGDGAVGRIAPGALEGLGLTGDFADALPESVDVRLRFTGPPANPELSVDAAPLERAARDTVGSLVGKAVDDTRQAIEDDIADAADEALDEARERADTILAQAEREGRRLRREARAEADRLVERAGDNPLVRAGAEKAADAALAQARKAEQRVLEEARNRADRILENARERTR